MNDCYKLRFGKPFTNSTSWTPSPLALRNFSKALNNDNKLQFKTAWNTLPLKF